MIVKEGGVPRTIRSRGLLLEAITTFDASKTGQLNEQSSNLRWLDGVKFQPRPCRGQQLLFLLPCVDQVFDNSGTDCLAYLTQLPFEIADTLIGSPLQLSITEDLDPLLDERMVQMKSFAFARSLIGPVTTPGMLTFASQAHAPVGAPFNGVAMPINQAIAVLENELARTLFGAQGIIHMSPGMLHRAEAGGGLDLNGDTWMTANGTVVVGDAGYVDAQKPQGSASSDQTVGTDEWIYASGPVQYQFYDGGMIGDDPGFSTDIAKNKLRRYRTAMGILIFDPCPVTAVLATYVG